MTALALVAVMVLVLLNGFFVAAEYRARARRAAAALEPAGRGDRRREGTPHAHAARRHRAATWRPARSASRSRSLAIGCLGEPAIGRLLRGRRSGGPLSHGLAGRHRGHGRLPDHHVAAHRDRRAVPKLYAIEHAETIAMRISRPLRLFAKSSSARSPSSSSKSANGDPARAGHRQWRRVRARTRPRPTSSSASSPSRSSAASSTPARPGCSPASSTCTSSRRAR